MVDNHALTKSSLLKQINDYRIPRHIAIIMDGNGRWAQGKNQPRIKGHQAGVKSVDEIAESCTKIGVKRLTLYAFSSENWKRPQDEVDALMSMLKQYLISKKNKIMRNKIRLTAIGNLELLPDSVKTELYRVIRTSKNNSRMTLCLALNYGGKNEILDAINGILSSPSKPKYVNERILREYLYDPSMIEPDLMIRTGGEIRISNFLLWHITYSELYFTQTLWPDFRTKHLLQAIKEFSNRKRRYGGLDDYQN